MIHRFWKWLTTRYEVCMVCGRKTEWFWPVIVHGWENNWVSYICGCELEKDAPTEQ